MNYSPDIFARQLDARKRSRKRWILGIAVGVLLMPLAMLGGLLTTRTGREAAKVFMEVIEVLPDPERYVFQGRHRINFVLIGRDEDRDNKDRVLNTNGRSDTLIVASLMKGENAINLLSIPRDTLAHIPGHGATRVNAAHSFGGPPLLMETLRESFGLQTDYYIQLKYDGFKKAVDAVGGVDMDVPKDMNYDDKWGQLHIHLKKGFQHLNGQQAHDFVRFRHDRLGDIGRIERQQMLMKALAKKLLSRQMVLSLHKRIPVLRNCVNTNMQEKQLIALAVFMRNIKPEDIHGEMLPGRPDRGYWVANPDASTQLLSAMFGDTFDHALLTERLVSAAPEKPTPKKRSKKPTRPTEATEEPVYIDTEPEMSSPDSNPAPGDAEPPSSDTSKANAPPKNNETSPPNPQKHVTAPESKRTN